MRTLWALCIGLLLWQSYAAAQPYDWWQPSLHTEALLNPSPVTVSHFSSWERNGGNSDMGGYYGTDRFNWKILADVDGPGAMVEFWCTRQETHAMLDSLKLRIYVNDTLQPVIQAPLFEFFGHTDPLLTPLADSSTSAFYCYVPIPFQSHLRVTYSGERGLYYHISTHHYPAGTPLESFSMPPSAAYLQRLDSLRQRLLHPTQTAWPTRVPTTHTATLQLAGNSTVDALSFTGPGGGRILQCLASTRTQANLEQIWISLYTDHRILPDIEGPLSSVFGAALGWHPYGSSITGMSGDTMYLNLPIPYRSECHIQLRNTGSSSQQVMLRAETVVLEPAAVPLYRMRGIYHHDSAAGNWRLYDIACLRGGGAYLGMALDMRHTNPNVYEGDEMIWLNGAGAPQWRGTGTEDYFDAGYYWHDGTQYTALPFHGCIYFGSGRCAAYRWHLPDFVPFQSGYRMAIEVGPIGNLQGDYRSMAYVACPREEWSVSNAAGDSTSLSTDTVRIAGFCLNPGTQLSSLRMGSENLTVVSGNNTANSDSALDVRATFHGVIAGTYPIIAVFSNGTSDTVISSWRYRDRPAVRYATIRLDENNFCSQGDTLCLSISGVHANCSAVANAGGMVLPWVGAAPNADGCGQICSRVTIPWMLTPGDYVIGVQESGSPCGISSDTLHVRPFYRWEVEEMRAGTYSAQRKTTEFVPEYLPNGVVEPWGRDLAVTVTMRDTNSYAEYQFNLPQAGNYRAQYFFGRTGQGARFRVKIDNSIDIADYNSYFATPGMWRWTRSDTVAGQFHTLAAGSHTVRFEISGLNTANGLYMILDQMILQSDQSQFSGLPTAPARLTAYPVESGIELRWQPVVDDERGIPVSPTGYKILRSMTGYADWTIIATVPSTQTTYVDEESMPNHPVFYEVIAENNP